MGRRPWVFSTLNGSPWSISTRQKRHRIVNALNMAGCVITAAADRSGVIHSQQAMNDDNLKVLALLLFILLAGTVIVGVLALSH